MKDQTQDKSDESVLSETIKRAREADQHTNIALGLGLLVIGIFGMSRQLDDTNWAHSYAWLDVIIFASGLSATLHALLRRAPLEMLGYALLTSGTLAYRYDLFVLNAKVVFFGLILFTAVGMIIRGMLGSSR